ncbi:MAG TPA: 4-alpha-glucanotransferase [Gaiellaceae bacterium]|nr:4-alpha-glucanotransferase [Gaiellaceae bacterium]
MPRASGPGTRRRREALALPRSGGVLLHPTSLPGGRLGPEAYRFVDWLVAAGQSYWQVLPLGPPDEFGSPYAGASAFAGWGGLLSEPDAPVPARAAAAFRRRQAFWIDDWVEFTGDPRELEGQVRFEREWSSLRRYANRRGVRLVGDVPLYVARDSADVAVHPDLFDLSFDAGAHPDVFSRSGQLWGNPTYRWATLRETGYRWWVERFRRALELFDVVRLDHFRGYVSYWAVRHGNRTARRGRWLRGPGRDLFDCVRGELGPLPLIAEDLGHITPAVHVLREELGLPGMHVLQWAFGGGHLAPHALANHREYAVVYLGSHDNDTAAGWYATAPAAIRRRVEAERAPTGIDEGVEPSWALVELTLSSRARLAVLQAQDVLGLGSAARMNTPSTIGGNWEWRLEPGQLDAGHAARLHAATRRRRRLPPPPAK